MIAVQENKLVPEVKAQGFQGNLPLFQKDPFKFLNEATSQYGDIVRFRMGLMYFYFVNHPDYIKHILITNRKNYHRDHKFLAEATPFLGQGLLTTDDEVWARLRRIVQPVFNANQLAKFASNITQATEAYIKRWNVQAKSAKPLDIADEMLRLTLDIVAPTLFGTDVTDEWQAFIDAVNILQAQVGERLLSAITLPLWLPTHQNRLARQALQTLDHIVFRMIAEYRKTEKQGNHLMSALIMARDETTGESLTDKEIRDQILTLLTAGYETTASALSWIWYLLSQHSEVEQKLRSEVETVLGNSPPAYHNISSMKYTRMVIQETLRLYPPIWIFARSPLKRDILGDYKIPANTVVYISPLVLHRHPEFWDCPEEFKPERFDPALEQTYRDMAYIPFGAGPRSCIGRNFAMMMMQLIVPKIIQEYRFYLVPEHKVKPKCAVSLHSNNGIYMNLEKVE